jgi:hypothetical protein
MFGNKYQVWIDGVNIYGGWQTDSNSRFITATGVGLYSNNSAGNGTTRWDNLAVWPHAVTLPPELQASGAASLLSAWTVGSSLANDTFTDVNGTLLPAHTAESGGAWTSRFGTWTITSNKAVPSGSADGSGHRYITQSINVADVECSVDITQPAVFGSYIFCGLIAYIDASNWIAVRLAQDIALQPNDQEIEITQVVAGVGNVVHKVQFGIAYAAGSTHTLKAQFKGDRLRIFFDGEPRESYVMSAALTQRVHYGLYQNNTDGGAVFDNWSVKAL